jgi:hypothetical protein
MQACTDALDLLAAHGGEIRKASVLDYQKHSAEKNLSFWFARIIFLVC